MRVLGAQKILKTNPFARPKKPKDSMRPLCHAPLDLWHEYRKLYNATLNAFREASVRFRAGELDTIFPEWTHPPALLLARPAPG